MGNGKRRRLQGLPLMTGVPKEFIKILKRFPMNSQRILKNPQRFSKNSYEFLKNSYKFSTEFLLNNRNLNECQFVNFVPVHSKKKSFLNVSATKKKYEKML